MPGTDDRREILGVDADEDVRVATPSEGVYVFYTERGSGEEYLRTDRVVDLSRCR